MNSKRLAVFAASVQWADAVKVMSRGNPKVSDVGVCRGEKRKKWREVPDGEACTFVGVD